MAQVETQVYDESERQFQFIQSLKKLDFLSTKNFKDIDDNNNQDGKTESTFKSDLSLVETATIEDDEQIYDDTINEDVSGAKKPIDIINEKISKLDMIFSNFSDIKPVGRRSSYEVVPENNLRDLILKQKEKEKKDINLFASIYSMKTVIYNLKTDIPLSYSMTNEESESSKIPKLVELYQFTNYENSDKIKLPHDIILEDVLYKVLQSVSILEKQPQYKFFLYEVFFSEPCKRVIHDTFWWCFLERYQKMPSIQYEYFTKVSENYVKLLFADLKFRYRESFFKSFPNLLAMSVYTIFCSCFPQSYMTHFNDDFREFICQITHNWISGCKPIPRSYSNWNLKALDPKDAVFAQEVLNKKQNNILEDIENIGTAYQNSNMTSRTSHITTTHDKKSSMASSLNKRRQAIIPSTLSEVFSNKSSKSSRLFRDYVKKESHPACRGPEFEESLFDILGHSPLVDFYMYNHNARKINNTETLIRHSSVTQLPPLNAITYQDVINQSLKNIKTLEKEMKLASQRNKNEYLKLHNENAKSLKEYSENREKLLSKPREVAIMGELIAMNSKKDLNSTNFPLDSALKKAFQNASKS